MRAKSDCVNSVTELSMPTSASASKNDLMPPLTVDKSPGWLVIRLSCRSKPPSDTKNTWRDIDNCERTAIIFATVRSCVASVESVTPVFGIAAKL